MTKDTKKGRAGLAGTKYRIKCGINVATRLNCCDNTGSWALLPRLEAGRD